MDDRIDRSRILEDQPFDRDDRHGKPPTYAAVTVKVNSYPTTALAMYGIQKLDVFGPETEGSQPTLTPVGPVNFAANISGVVPPLGSYVIATELPEGRTVIG